MLKDSGERQPQDVRHVTAHLDLLALSLTELQVARGDTLR